MKLKHQRLVFVTVSIGFLCMATLLAMQAFRNNVIFFYSPSDLVERDIVPGQLIRLGGLVETGSVVRNGTAIRFLVTDGNRHIAITYQGMLPGLFRERQGIVAEGHLVDGTFEANRILTKHDEYYMPKEVVDTLKKTGQWKGP